MEEVRWPEGRPCGRERWREGRGRRRATCGSGLQIRAPWGGQWRRWRACGRGGHWWSSWTRRFCCSGIGLPSFSDFGSLRVCSPLTSPLTASPPHSAPSFFSALLYSPILYNTRCSFLRFTIISLLRLLSFFNHTERIRHWIFPPDWKVPFWGFLAFFFILLLFYFLL